MRYATAKWYRAYVSERERALAAPYTYGPAVEAILAHHEGESVVARAQAVAIHCGSPIASCC